MSFKKNSMLGIIALSCLIIGPIAAYFYEQKNKAESDEQQKEIKSLNDTIDKKVNEIASLNNKILSISEKVDSITDELKDISIRIDSTTLRNEVISKENLDISSKNSLVSEELKKITNKIEKITSENLNLTTDLKNQSDADYYFSNLSYKKKLYEEFDKGFYLVWQRIDGKEFKKAFFEKGQAYVNVETKLNLENGDFLLKEYSIVEEDDNTEKNIKNNTYNLNVDISDFAIGKKQNIGMKINDQCNSFILTEITSMSVTYAFGYSKCE